MENNAWLTGRDGLAYIKEAIPIRDDFYPRKTTSSRKHPLQSQCLCGLKAVRVAQPSFPEMGLKPTDSKNSCTTYYCCATLLPRNGIDTHQIFIAELKTLPIPVLILWSKAISGFDTNDEGFSDCIIIAPTNSTAATHLLHPHAFYGYNETRKAVK